MKLEPMLGRLGLRQEYNLDGMPVHQRVLYTQTYTARASLANLPTGVFWGSGKKLKILDVLQTDRKVSSRLNSEPWSCGAQH